MEPAHLVKCFCVWKHEGLSSSPSVHIERLGRVAHISHSSTEERQNSVCIIPRPQKNWSQRVYLIILSILTTSQENTQASNLAGHETQVSVKDFVLKNKMVESRGTRPEVDFWPPYTPHRCWQGQETHEARSQGTDD